MDRSQGMGAPVPDQAAQASPEAASASSPSGEHPSRNRLYCSFCGKHDQEVLCLIAGPTLFICDECVLLCQDIVFDHRVARAVRLQTAIAIEARSDATGTGAAEGESAAIAQGAPQ